MCLWKTNIVLPAILGRAASKWCFATAIISYAGLRMFPMKPSFRIWAGRCKNLRNIGKPFAGIQNAAYMLDLSAYLFHRMTGEWAYEFAGARATNLVDIPSRTWDAAMSFPAPPCTQNRIAESSEKSAC